MNPISNKKGFTLIELLIVITIIGILAVAFLPSLLGAPAKARDTQRIADVQKIAGVLTNYTIANTTITGGCVGATTTSGTPPTTSIEDLGGIIRPEDFGGKIPSDPSPTNTVGSACKGYLVIPGDKTVTTNAYSFGVFAKLENAPQGNFDCDIISSATGAATNLASDTYVTGPGDDQNCYAVLVQ